MPCTKCRSDFNLLNWKIKCGECEDKYCNKCLKRREGVLYCEKCLILLKRPPDRFQLMELKSKDLQDYLNKRNISTYGLIEKHELVDLFYNRHIPVKPKRGVEKLTANFAGSVPNLKPLNDFFGNLDSVISNGTRPTRSERPDPRPSPSVNPHSYVPPQEQPTGFTQPAQSACDDSQPQATTSTGSSESPENTQTQKEGESTSESPVPPRYPKIDDFGSIEELQGLSAKDLKILLTLNRIDYKGCVEKQELLDRAKRLWEDSNEQKKEPTENLPIQDLCKLCMDAPLDCVLLQCGHMATCIECGKKLAECPICRQYIARVVRTFKA
ncbi:E3 ubiquitin-protein ligase RNF34 [Anoplophora glabripennis]|uniref:E3 ubiquitin-protein ligase RNF34 n=1 Tax=Anoplophora glabripennis TaxID=217634 RepID=UPI000874FB19|nr:E3 ubiquitin-protein ligase RNF34 [Anoplophora glabripennis]